MFGAEALFGDLLPACPSIKKGLSLSPMVMVDCTFIRWHGASWLGRLERPEPKTKHSSKRGYIALILFVQPATAGGDRDHAAHGENGDGG